MSDPTCSVAGCPRYRHARGWCSTHYDRWRKYGDPLIALPKAHGTPEARFWRKVDQGGPVPDSRPDLGPCWLWTGHVQRRTGYAKMRVGDRHLYVHRFAYETFVAPIPDGMELDHLCFVRHCVNYERHLEVVTPRENVLRSLSAPTAVNARKTHCKRGHEFTPENTRWWRGKRSCRTCARAADAERYRRLTKPA